MRTNKKFAVALLASLLMVGCISAATVASYLPIFEAALNGVIALVAPGASANVTADEAKVNSSVQTLVAAVGAVQGAPSVSVALTGVESAATQLESDLGVANNNDAKLAVAILDLAIGTYQAIIANQQSLKTAGFSVPAAKSRKYATSAGDFKRQFNTLCDQYGHSEMKMKLTVAERLHVR